MWIFQPCKPARAGVLGAIVVEVLDLLPAIVACWTFADVVIRVVYTGDEA